MLARRRRAGTEQAIDRARLAARSAASRPAWSTTPGSSRSSGQATASTPAERRQAAAPLVIEYVGSWPRARTLARRDGTGTSTSGPAAPEPGHRLGEQLRQRPSQREQAALLVAEHHLLDRAVVGGAGERRDQPRWRRRGPRRPARRWAAARRSQRRAADPARRSRRSGCPGAGRGQRLRACARCHQRPAAAGNRRTPTPVEGLSRRSRGSRSGIAEERPGEGREVDQGGGGDGVLPAVGDGRAGQADHLAVDGGGRRVGRGAVDGDGLHAVELGRDRAEHGDGGGRGPRDVLDPRLVAAAEGDLLRRTHPDHLGVGVLQLEAADAQLVDRHARQAGLAGADHGHEAGAVAGDQERRHLPSADIRHVEDVRAPALEVAHLRAGRRCDPRPTAGRRSPRPG